MHQYPISPVHVQRDPPPSHSQLFLLPNWQNRSSELVVVVVVVVVVAGPELE